MFVNKNFHYFTDFPLDKNGSNISEPYYWNIKIITLKENIEPMSFYDTYINIYQKNANFSSSAFNQPKETDYIEKIFEELEYTSTLPLIVMQPELR